jgi:hypothetical protein
MNRYVILMKNFECLRFIDMYKLLNKHIKIINLVHLRLNLNDNVFHIDHVVHKKVRFLSPLKRMMKIQHPNNIFSKNVMKFHDNVPYFYVIFTYYVRNEKPYIKKTVVYICVLIDGYC